MPSSRIAFAEIESYTPAIDARAVENGSVFVLAGQNYVFDVKGPKSGFGSRLVTGGVIEAGIYPVQSVDVGGRSIVCSQSGVFDRRWTFIDEDSLDPSVAEWFRIGTLVPDVESNIGRFKWTSAYVGFGGYICHPSHGIKQVLGNSIVNFKPDGLVESPMFIAEANGRLIIVGRFQIQWSNASNPDDLRPELGGAGFQTSAELVPGEPRGIMSFQGGFIVYTSAGVLLFEYVGNDIVFRPDRIVTQQLLLTPSACCELANGEMALMTQQGLYVSSASEGMSEMTPRFNAYLLKLLENAEDVSIRLDYITEKDQLFVQMMDSTATFRRTWVLTTKIDKWGEFNETHRGIVRFSRDPGNYGWIDYDGYGHRIDESSFVELSDGTLRGLESEIKLGYFRPANGADNADLGFEIQEVLITARTTQTSAETQIEEDWLGPDSFVDYNLGFYNYDIDYNDFGVDYYDINYSMPGDDEDWNLGPVEDVDFNLTVSGDQDFDYNKSGWPDEDFNLTPAGGVNTDYIIDWGSIPQMAAAPIEDWNGEQSLLNLESYNIVITGNMDGFTQALEVIPSLAWSDPERDLWTGFTFGHEHMITLSANQAWEKFHVKSLAITAHLAGQYS